MSSKEKIKITISESFSPDKAIKKFKRLCDSYGIIKEYRKRESYSKPSIREREKREAAEKRRKKTASKMNKFSNKL